MGISVTPADKTLTDQIPDIVCVSFDPNSRDAKMLGSEKAFGFPGVEMIIQVINTDLGTCLTDPSIGVDRSSFKSMTPGVVAQIESAYRDAIGYLQPDIITDLRVVAKIFPERRAYQVTIDFVDATLQTPIRIEDNRDV